MSCEFRVTSDDSISEFHSIVNPILTGDVRKTKKNKWFNKSFSGLVVKLLDSLDMFTRHGKRACTLDIIVTFTRTNNGSLLVLSLVMGKNTPSISRLTASIRALNTRGRSLGAWKIQVPLIDAYDSIDISKVVKAYLVELSDYPGIIEFVVKSSDERKIKHLLDKYS